jgi:CRISPR system Cascade subunit CasE
MTPAPTSQPAESSSVLKGVLSRVRLRRSAPLQTLAPILVPTDTNARLATSHRLIWALFPGSPEQERDFLWREDMPDGALATGVTFTVLSTRPPANDHNLFDIASKPFAPELAAGDHLGFLLRVNPVVSRRTSEAQKRGKRLDPIAARIKQFPETERPGKRDAVVQEVARDWLTAQGERHGFRLPIPESVRAEDDWRRVKREKGQGFMQFSVVDLQGRLEVTDPVRFLAALSAGFGKAKAFGCGLMLIRRLPAPER